MKLRRVYSLRNNLLCNSAGFAFVFIFQTQLKFLTRALPPCEHSRYFLSPVHCFTFKGCFGHSYRFLMSPRLPSLSDPGGCRGAAQSAVLCVNAFNEWSSTSSFKFLGALSQLNFVVEFVGLLQKTPLKHSVWQRQPP